MFRFELLKTDDVARRGRMHTAHGTVETPAFMAVGTQATVKGVTPDVLEAIGTQVVLGNTYHLALRPGDELIAERGGLHRFMGWRRPILTDSGGYQVFSLAANLKITDAAAVFRSHIDGALLELSPEKAVRIQENLGSDIAMCLDQCPPLGERATEGLSPKRQRGSDTSSQGLRVNADESDTEGESGPSSLALRAQSGQDGREMGEAVRRTLHWAERCKAAHRRPDQALFAIVQGGLDLELRGRCAEALVALDFPGYALGGFSVGETTEQMVTALGPTAALLPATKPRYLMGVGRPQDILAAVARGVDMFDCVLPTRNGRNATAFTGDGMLKLRNARHKRDDGPIESGCACPTCRTFSRAYMHHLFLADEMLGPILLTVHNLAYYNRLLADIRGAIEAGRFAEFCSVSLARLNVSL